MSQGRNDGSYSHRHKRRRKDMYDEEIDRKYKYTHEKSQIQNPTFVPPNLFENWKDRANRALTQFQKDPRESKSTADEPSNPIMRELLQFVSYVKDATVSSGLQDEVLYNVYSSEMQRRKLKQPMRYRRYGDDNRNNFRTYHSDWYDKLPGPLPHNVTRRSLYRLDQFEYWVTEKSDGIRFMLLFSKRGSAYFVDRKFGFYRIKHPFYANLCKMHKTSLFDGELILTNAKLMYLAFDCVAIQGESVSNQVTSLRLSSTEKFIHESKAKLKVFKEHSKEPIPIHLHCKRHYSANTDIHQLLDQIIREPHTGEYVFTERDSNDEIIRESHNDGLVFTPESNNYMMDTDTGALLKWKFLEKNTIDLKVKKPYFFRGMLEAYAYGPKNKSTGCPTDILFTKVKLNEEERRHFEKLEREIKHLNPNRFVDSFIIEFGYDFGQKKWLPIQTRPDKHKPNFITVCTDTLLVMMDNITTQELAHVCERKQEPHNDAFDSY